MLIVLKNEKFRMITIDSELILNFNFKHLKNAEEIATLFLGRIRCATLSSFQKQIKNVIEHKTQDNVNAFCEENFRVCRFCGKRFLFNKKNISKFKKILFKYNCSLPNWAINNYSSKLSRTCSDCYDKMHCKICDSETQNDCCCKTGDHFENSPKLNRYIKIQNRFKELTIGFEFELEFEEDFREVNKKKFDLFTSSFFYGVVPDCSLDNGNEYLSTPRPLKFWRSNEFKKLFKLLTEGAKTSENCALHFSVSRNTIINYKQLENMKRLLLEIKRFYFKNYLKFWNRNIEKLNKHAQISKGLLNTHDRRYAINLTNYDRIEFRFLGNTIDYNRFLEYLDFIELFFEFTKTDYKAKKFNQKLNQKLKKGIKC